MKWLTLTVILLFPLFLFSRPPPAPLTSVPTISPTPTSTDGQKISAITLLPSQNVALHFNLADKLTLAQAKEQYQCSFIVSAGFYTKDDRPIGYFISDGKMIRNRITSSLFNGFLTIGDKTTIGTEIGQNVTFGLQSGPLLYLDGKPLSLRIKNDEPARRIVAAIDGSGMLNFLAIYDPNATYSGPLLSDLPNVLEQSDINIADAVNLDGGSASGMITDGVNLGELTTVGSFFCIKN